MSESKHTPGKWELEVNGQAFNLRSPDRVEHFCILLGMQSNNDGEHEANANLIAAAPELLGGYLIILDRLATNPMQDEELADLCRFLIAKAETK